MVYTFARVGAVLQMNVGDYFTQGRRGWVRLHEKGGKEHEAPCHHKLEAFLDEYLKVAGIAKDKDGPLFRTTGRATGTPHRTTQPDAYRMLQRRARQTGIKTHIGHHSLRATGINDYLKSDGTLPWRTPNRWRTTPRPAPPSSTTGATRKPRSTSTSELEFESCREIAPKIRARIRCGAPPRTG